MLSKEKKQKIKDKIISSETFKNAPTSIALLQYLIQANFDERPLKERIIDLEFFKGDPDSEKSNPRVRVNVYNLRKKLDRYYEEEGADDIYRVVIEKGQYSIRFEEHQKNKIKSRLNIRKLLPYLLFIATLFALIIVLIPPTKPLFWKKFFINGHLTYLYIGDAFGYGGETVSGLRGWTRDFSINSTDEYYQLLEQNQELKTKTALTDFNYSTRMAENATHDLARIFTKNNSDFTIKYATQTSFSDIKKGNTIYVGRLKDQANFVYLFNEANQYITIDSSKIVLTGSSTINDTTIQLRSGITEKEYAVVSRIPGSNNTEQFLFFSDHDIGVMATVEFFTNPDSIKRFAEQHLHNEKYFTAIFVARGKERINLDLETILVVPVK